MSEERMTIEERYKYLRMMQKRYQDAGRKEQGELLAEMEEITKLHRKSLIRMMNGLVIRKRREKQRGQEYGRELDTALGVISRSMDHPCAERLQPNLGWMADQLVEHRELVITTAVREQLDRVSVSTVQRRLERMKIDRRLPKRRPEEANRWRREVPARRIAWDEKEAGHFEVDLVHHCGLSASGQYVHTLQMVDVATGWSERVAVLGRSYLAMQDGFERILARLPIPVREIHPDNGSEFFNDHIKAFWFGVSPQLQWSRSRPWQKNDNRFIEQKNDSLVRAYLGYRRLDTVAHTNLLNYLYDLMWVFHNFFQPVMRLEEKVSITSPDKHHRVIRRFDRARTPFDRLLEKDILVDQCKEYYLDLRRQTNPLRLREQFHTLIHELLNLPEADEKQVQSVHDTLKLWNCALAFSALPGNPADPGLDRLVEGIYSIRKEPAFR